MKEIFKDKVFIKKIICVVAYFIITMVLVYPFSYLIDWVMGGSSGYSKAAVFQLFMYVILAIVCMLLMKNEFISGLDPLRKKSASTTIVEILVGCVIVYGAMFVGTVMTKMLGASSDSANQLAIEEIMSKPIGVIMIPALCVIGPIVEELVFRGALQGGLEKLKMPRWLCVIIAGTLFGLIHVIDAGDFVQLPSYLLSGLAFGYIYYKSENIYAPISVHIIFNCLSTWSVYMTIISEMLGIPMA